MPERLLLHYDNAAKESKERIVPFSIEDISFSFLLYLKTWLLDSRKHNHLQYCILFGEVGTAEISTLGFCVVLLCFVLKEIPKVIFGQV